MVVSTRNTLTGSSNGSSLVLDDETKRFLVKTIAGMVEGSLATMQRSMEEIAKNITAFSSQNQQMGNRGPQMHHSRLAKIEFPEFSGDDVKGWVFRCDQFFLIEQTPKMVKQAILNRFSNGYDDPMSKLKILKYETTAREYEDAFDNLLSRVEVSEEHVVSLFMGGLPTEIERGVRMFKPKTLADAYCLTNLQHATMNAVKKKNKTPFTPSNSRYNSGSTSTFKPLRTTSNNVSGTVNTKPNNPVTGRNRRLSQKEYVEKRAQNFCFYCDKKYVPGHKCSGQLYSLVLVPEDENEKGGFLDKDETLVDKGSMDLQAPLISLIALTGTTNFKTMRVIAVTMADGNNLITTSECKHFKWQFGSTTFTTYVMLLPLGGCEMILGIQWFATLRDIRFNFHDLRMDFKYNGKRVLLRGTHKTNLDWLNTKTSDKIMRQAELHSMAMSYEDVFYVPTKLPPRRDHDHIIPLIEGAQPVNIRPYRHPSTQKDAIEGMVAELLEAEVIKKSNSPFFSPIVMVDLRIMDSWQTDLKLKEIIEKLKQGQAKKGLILELIRVEKESEARESLPKSQGKTLIFMIVDKLSKYAHFIPLVHPFNAIDVAQVFLDNIYKLHGLPNTIISDRDKVFLTGQTEVVNRCLECYLRCMTGEQPKQWMKCMSMAEWWYNTNHHSAINTTPYEMVYGQTPPIHVPYMGGESKVEVVDRTLSARKESIEVCKFHLKRAQDRMKSQADKKRIHREFQVGDWSLVTQYGTLPACNPDGVLLMDHVAILDRRLAKKGNVATVFVLIQWANWSKRMSHGNPLKKYKRNFLIFNFDLEDKIILRRMD
ncbi:reverse transcriptase [Tanacetum coccineum]